MSEGIECVWVIAVYRGAQAKRVGALADAGVSYITVDRDSSSSITVAFRYVIGEDGLPHHLQEVTDPWKIQKYEKLRKGYHGNSPSKVDNVASAETVKRVKDIFYSRKKF